MELNNLYNMDCMKGMEQFPDKYFELAIIDPPYGINQSGGKIKLGARRRQQKIISHSTVETKKRRQRNTLKNCSEYLKIKLFLEQIILLAKYHMIAIAGLCGTRITAIRVLQIANLHGHPLIAPLEDSNICGAVCVKRI